MATNSVDPVHFTHTDLDGDKLEVIEADNGAVFWIDAAHLEETVGVSVHSGHDLQLLIDTLTAIQNNR